MQRIARGVFVFLLVFSFCAISLQAVSFDGSADVVLADNDILTMASGTIGLAADRVISLPGSGVQATVKIGASAGSGAVTIRPSTSSANCILVFDVREAGSVLEVQALNDLRFHGNGAKPMYIGVRGKGEVRLRIPSGRAITFDAPTGDDQGAHLRVLMALNKLEADTYKQLSFVSWSHEADEVNTDLDAHTLITIGQKSSFSFISQHKSGLVDGTGVLDYGYGVIAFDPSNLNGTGRMILKIKAGSSAVDFNDGSFMAYGSYVQGSGLTPTDVLTADMRTSVIYKYRAGIAAKVCIDDLVARADYRDDELTTFLNDRTNSRGLVVLNYNNSYPRLANNYDQTVAVAAPEDFESITGLTESAWFTANTVQTGFVLGNNGVLEIENNRFLDYYAARTDALFYNFPKDGVHVATGATDEGEPHDWHKTKKHNPSAFIIDGNAFRKTGTTAAADVLFEYDATDYAHIILHGFAGIFARVAAPADGAVWGSNLTIDSDGNTASDLSKALIDGTIGRATYDGSSAILYEEDGVTPAPAMDMFGSVALDIEGAVHIESKATWDDAVGPAGFVNVPTLMVNHRGREVAYDTRTDELAEATDRPLSTEFFTYPRYNNSVILVNDFVRLNRVRLVHNDVGRDVSLIGTGLAYPAIIGGELPSLTVAKKLADDPSAWILDYTGSPIYLENSTIECHESLVSAGVRWVVRDGVIGDEDELSAGDNASRVVLYHRGMSYDLELSGMGRYFQLGSRLNKMADNNTINPIQLLDGTYPASSLRDAFINVYRQRPIPLALMEEGTEQNTIKLSFATDSELGVPSAEKSMHAIHIADRSKIELGWPAGQYKRVDTTDDGPVTTYHLEADERYAAWEYSDAVLDALRGIDPENADGHRFSPYTYGRGTLEFNGDYLYVDGAGRYASSGLLHPEGNELLPRGVRDQGGIVYANFGGALTAEDSHDVIVNTVIGRRTCRIRDGSGIIGVPADQLILQENGRIETYGFDAVVNPSPTLVNATTTPIVAINVSELPVPEGFEPVKGIEYRAPHDWAYRRRLTRSTDSVTSPVAMPTSGMLVMGSGDTIEQAQVFGATRANPFHLRLSGDGTGFARVREFVSMTSDPRVLGEGAHAALFMDNSARIGLGSRQWNANSVNAWNQLGLDKVTIFPNGNGVIDLNSDLIITDKLPLIATEDFGMGSSAHQLIFYSDVPREIRVLAGGELDLSSFGRGGAAKQQIVFSGQVRLVLEPGAKIRFPSTVTDDDVANGPILYFNDSSQCVFASNEDPDATRYSDALNGTDKIRAKILGIGQIWLNKEAKMTIYDNAMVGVEADAQTPITNITLSVQRQAKLLIGDVNRAGGAFQVGNVIDGGGDGSNMRTLEDAIPTAINFTLTLNGDAATCHIDRSGFLGLGAGVVNKTGNPNGQIPSATADPELDPDEEQYGAWRVQTLANVKNITLNITRGYFDHNQIYSGSSADSYGSVIAVGPIDYNEDAPLSVVNGGRYTLTLGKPTEAFIRGGGNVLFVDAGIPQNDPLAVSIWSTSADIVVGGSNSGKYTILAPSPMIRTYTTPIGSESITATTTSYSFRSQTVSDGDKQGGALNEVYQTLSMPIYGGYPAKFVAAGKNSGGVTAGYLIGTTIMRSNVVVAKDKFGNSVSPTLALDKGYFDGTNSDSGSASGGPESLRVP